MLVNSRDSGSIDVRDFEHMEPFVLALTRNFDPSLIRQRCCLLRQLLKEYLESRGSAGPETEAKKLSGSARHDRKVSGTSHSAARNHQSAGIAFLRWN